MIKQSGILEDSDYQKYEIYVQEDVLDEEGYYTETSEITRTAPNAVHVTFGNNNNLQIRYYADDAHQLSLNSEACYLYPGDTIFADVKINKDVFSSMYEFAGFRILENDEENNMIVSESVVIKGDDTNYSISIPDSFRATEISIIPLGEYQKRTIKLRKNLRLMNISSLMLKNPLSVLSNVLFVNGIL